MKLTGLGYRVTGTSRNPLEASKRLPGVEFVHLDLLDEESIDRCVEEAGEIDVLINNAGISQIGSVEDTPDEKFKELLQVNLLGMIRLTRAYLPQLRAKKESYIINISSLAGKFAVPFQSSYVASKFALNGFSWSLRNEVRRYGVKVVVVEPNDISTTIDPEIFLQENSAYEESIHKVKAARLKGMAAAQGTAVVVNKIVRILQMRNPKPYYAVGKHAGLLTFLKRLTPDSVVEKLIRSNYDLK